MGCLLWIEEGNDIKQRGQEERTWREDEASLPAYNNCFPGPKVHLLNTDLGLLTEGVNTYCVAYFTSHIVNLLTLLWKCHFDIKTFVLL